MKINMRFIMMVVVFGLLALSVAFTGREIYKQIALTRLLDSKMHSYAQRKMDNALQKISAKFQLYAQIVRDAAKELGGRQWDKASLDLFLKSKIEQNKDIGQIVIAFKPYAFEKSTKLYAPYYTRLHDLKKITSTFVAYDYTLPSAQAGDHTEWYRDFINTGQGWTDPYFSKLDKKHFITYSAQFFSPSDKKNALGVVEVDIDLDYLRGLVNSLALGKLSYGLIITAAKGTFVSIPMESIYRKRWTIFDLAKYEKIEDLAKAGRYILSHKEGGIVSYYNGVTGTPSLVLFQPILGTNFIFGIVFIKDGFFSPNINLFKHHKIKIALGVVLSLLLLLLLMVFFLSNIPVGLIFISAVYSIILIGGIGYLWWVQRGLRAPNDDGRIQAGDSNSIAKMRSASVDLTKKISNPINIATGVLFDQIEFVSNSQISLSGFVWQKYALPCDASIARDFMMPQSKTLFKKDLIFQGKNEKEEVCVWKVSGNIGQDNLITEAFPFDAQGIDILFTHPSLNKNVLLVPDLGSYKFLNPEQRPGTAISLKVLDVILEKAFFSFKSMMYDADLGMKNFGGVVQRYALCFTVEARRCLAGFIIMYILPLLVALLLLFINLCVTKPDRIMTNISLTSGTFLGLILAHSAMRKSLVGSTVLYLEYFYIVPYFLIILLLINLILYSQENQISFVKYQDNLLTKVLFWPSFLLIMFLITCWMFW